MNFNTWIRQPSTISGLAFAGAALAGALSHLATGNPTIDGIAATGVLVLVHLGIDDHSATAQAAGRLEADVATAIATRSPTGAIVQTLEDAAALARAFQTAMATPAPAGPAANPTHATPPTAGSPPAAS